VHPEHDDGASRPDQLDGAGHARRGSRRFDNDVIGAVASGAGAEPLAGFPLVPVARLEGDVGRSHAPRTRDREQPEGARADDHNARLRTGPAETRGVPRHRRRFDERRVAEIETYRHGHEAPSEV
jgi:hypothetical protein